MKGPDPAVVKKVAQILKDCGLTHFTFKSDREASIRSMLADATKLAGLQGTLEENSGEPDSDDEDADADSPPKPTKTSEQGDVVVGVPETSSPGESQSNGAAERAVQSVEEHLRTMKLALEPQIHSRIPCRHPVVS